MAQPVVTISKFGGTLVRRERWALSLRGWAVTLGILGLSFYGLIWGVHPFLTVDTGGWGEVLVVEGWISSGRIDRAAKAFQDGNYKRVVVVLGVLKEGNKWESGRYKAHYIAAKLVQLGVPENMVHTLFCPVVRKDRTYQCGLATLEFLAQEKIPVDSLDVVTMATHTRRSRLLFEKAFNGKVKVSTIALDDLSYDPEHWWRSSAGVRDVLSEAIGYLYARFLFRSD
ncbi:MAG: YdcF family protein [Verrucomicrobiales bacterium]|nr:YdcF family protein [Verrucomicrobiales bacterium]MDA7643827.1 YdcF family protein [Verrucomicrobiales bacterium]MDC0312631.1 YdcF family protein [Verrucomicrobiales bacterium]